MISIAQATEADVAEAAGVLADAFLTDPVMSEFFPRQRDRHQRLRQFYEATLRSHGDGGIDIARDHNRVVGVAIWTPPNSRRQLSARTISQIPRFIAAIRFDGMRRWLRLKPVFDEHHPKAPHWYLSDIGVSPAARGSGAGSALLEHRLELIDARGDLAYLESTTPASRRLYERFGFQTIAPISGFPDAEPVAMVRQPGEHAGKSQPGEHTGKN